jgi:hypothetical protein
MKDGTHFRWVVQDFARCLESTQYPLKRMGSVPLRVPYELPHCFLFPQLYSYGIVTLDIK